MSHKDTGNPFDKHAVLAACRTTLWLLELDREEHQAMLVAKYRYYRRFGFFGRRIERTREAALREAEKHYEYFTQFPNGIEGEFERQRILSIQATAKKVLGSVVWLDCEDFALIAAQYKSPKRGIA